MTERSELLTLENFRCAFLPSRLTAPRSPRMTDHTADIYLFIYFFANPLNVDKQTEPNVPYQANLANPNTNIRTNHFQLSR